MVEAEIGEMREPQWERELKRRLECLDRVETGLQSEGKGAGWKFALARHLRESHLVPDSWLALASGKLPFPNEGMLAGGQGFVVAGWKPVLAGVGKAFGGGRNGEVKGQLMA